MGKRTKDEVDDIVEEVKASEKPKKSKKERKLQEETLAVADDGPSITEAEVPEAETAIEQISTEDFDRMKPIFQKWLSEVKNK